MMKTRWNMKKTRRVRMTMLRSVKMTLRWRMMALCSVMLLQTLGEPAPQVPPNPLLGLLSPPPRKPYRQSKVQSLDRTSPGNRMTEEIQET